MQRLLEPFSFDPVAHPVRQVAEHSGIVHVANGGVVQPAKRLCLSEEPASGGWIEIHSEADPPLQQLIPGLEQRELLGGGNRALQTITVAQRRLGAPEIFQWLDCGQRRSPRRRSTVICRPHTVTLHQRRL